MDKDTMSDFRTRVNKKPNKIFFYLRRYLLQQLSMHQIKSRKRKK